MSFNPKPNPGIMSITPYVPGESKAGTGRVIKLAANENPYGFSPLAREAFISMADNLHRYPDGGSVALRQALGLKHGVDPARVVCGTGSDEIISLLCKAFTGIGDDVLMSHHGFLMYPIAALAAGATPVKAPESNRRTDLQSMLDHVTDKTKIVFLANPNNPTGSTLSSRDVRAFRESLREDILLVLDSAYAEYVTDPDYDNGMGLARDYDNVVVLHTFSKIYGLSALRVGWSYSSLAVADILNRVRGVFNINTAAQICALAALKDTDHVAKSARLNAEMRGWMFRQLLVHGLTPYESEGNFILFSAGSEQRADHLLDYLKKSNVLTRGMKAYDLADCVRLTIGTKDDMQAVDGLIADFCRKVAV